jgi:hypothetical protein
MILFATVALSIILGLAGGRAILAAVVAALVRGTASHDLLTCHSNGIGIHDANAIERLAAPPRLGASASLADARV